MLTSRLQGMRRSKSLFQKLSDLNLFIVTVVFIIAMIGFALLYSVSGGNVDPWAKKQVIRFVIGMAGMVFIALVDIRVWMFLAYPFYFFSLILLIFVSITGHTGMGATRWIDLGFMNLQPSELMKIALILALARYYHCLDKEDVGRYKSLLKPVFLIAAPAILVLLQPDLGTSLLIVLGGVSILFCGGVRMWIFVAGFIAMIPTAFGAWNFMKPYQQNRVLTFLNPERDPLGAGYHSIQAKIAIGSGGLYGKGFIQGSQSQLNFLPEKHTDFIFAAITEELGFVGGVLIFAGLFVVFWLLIAVIEKARDSTARAYITGIFMILFAETMIHVGMNMGVLPITGVPLPFVSAGGSALIGTTMAIAIATNAKKKE